VKTGCPCPPLAAPPGTWYTIGPTLWLAAKLEHVSWIGLSLHDHVDLRAHGDGGGRRRTEAAQPEEEEASEEIFTDGDGAKDVRGGERRVEEEPNTGTRALAAEEGGMLV